MTSLPLKLMFDESAIRDAEGLVDFLHDPYPDTVLDAKLGRPNYDITPHFIYTYRARIADGQIAVDHFLDGVEGTEIDPGDVPAAVARRLGDPTLPQPQRDLGSNFQLDGNHWDRVSYLAFIIDHDNWNFSDPSNGDSLPPAVFRFARGNGNDGKNHTFHDGRVLDIDISENGTVRRRSMFYCINHHRLHNGGRPDRPHQEGFKYDLCTKFRFDGTNELVLIFDPGGDNQGPPIGP